MLGTGSASALAAASSHLQRHPEQIRVRGLIPGSKLILDPALADLGRYLRDVDDGLKGLDLAEEQAPLTLFTVQ